MSGEYRIPAPQAEVWRALNDPDILQQAIPGCRRIGRVSDTEMTATVVAKFGPVKAIFSGRVTLADLNPPHGYTISGEGEGGAAGFANGSAKVSLTEDDGETLLRYVAEVQVGGKLAQIGQRLVGSTAKKTADDFFAAFVAAVIAQTPPVEAPEPPVPEALPPVGQQRGVRSTAWAIGLLVVVVALWIFHATQSAP